MYNKTIFWKCICESQIETIKRK